MIARKVHIINLSVPEIVDRLEISFLDRLPNVQEMLATFDHICGYLKSNIDIEKQKESIRKLLEEGNFKTRQSFVVDLSQTSVTLAGEVEREIISGGNK